MASQYKEATPIFDAMVDNFLPSLFDDRTNADLTNTLVALGQHPGKTKAVNKGKLVRYFRIAVNA